jgi:hypothetical protein
VGVRRRRPSGDLLTTGVNVLTLAVHLPLRRFDNALAESVVGLINADARAVARCRPGRDRHLVDW